jgi:LysM repeat protein
VKRLTVICLVLLLGIFLAACERPLRDSAETEAADGTVTPMAPIIGDDALDNFPAADATPEDAVTEAGSEDQTVGEGEDATTDAAAEGETSTEAETDAGSETEETPTILPDTDIIHQVESGETLGAIAQLYDVSIDDIVAANNLVNPDALDIGDQLLIPIGGLDEPAETEVDTGETDTGEEETGERTHIVQAGDTLYSIGRTYGFTIDELAEYNNLTDINRLEIGQVILIPPAE